MGSGMGVGIPGGSGISGFEGSGELGWEWDQEWDLERDWECQGILGFRDLRGLGVEVGVRVGIPPGIPAGSIPISPGLPWQWRSRDGSVALPAFPDSLRDLTGPFELCLTGEGLEQLRLRDRERLLRLIPHVRVFARVAPKQKVRGAWEWEFLGAGILGNVGMALG